MIRVELAYNNGFRWHSGQGIHVKGYLIHSGKYLTGNELAAFLNRAGSPVELSGFLSETAGSFSVIVERDGSVWLATDPLRVFPLFYRHHGNDLHISDNASLLAGKVDPFTPNRAAAVEFGAAGFVTGRETLFQGVFQVQPGELAWGHEGEWSRSFYFTYRTDDVFSAPMPQLEDETERVLEETFERLLQSVRGRTVVVPLSGGFDSRLVAAMLRKFGHEEVFCFTYGRKGNPEIAVSQRVAARLNYPWIYVEYNEGLIKAYPDDPDFLAYYPYSANATGMFFMQEYFAVKFLRDNKMVPGDAVFVPGHSGDFLGGSQFLKHGLPSGPIPQVSIEKVVRRIFDVKYTLSEFDAGERVFLRDRIMQSLRDKWVTSGFPYSIYEDWDMKEKIAKFIVNSCNVYAFFGYEYRLPLWDRPLAEFFRQVPYRYKSNKKLYDKVLTERVFESMGLNFGDELQPAAWRQRLEFLKLMVRRRLKIMKKKPALQDPIYYREITRKMIDDLKQRGKEVKIEGGSHNSVIVQWYLDRLERFCEEGSWS